MDKIICIGKNYLEHAKELGDAIPTHPIVFFKPPSSLTTASTFTIPKDKGEVHHELEIVLELSKKRRVALGLDLTLRTLQQDLKAKGHPWERAKAFPNSAVLTPWIPLEEFKAYLETPFYLKINGSLRQRGIGKDMRWNPEELIAQIHKDFTVCEGDLLFTGTPSGVGPLKAGDELELGFEGRETQKLKVN